MAWIEFHPNRIKKLQKFTDFRRSLQWSTYEALGFLGSLWGEVLDVQEDGEISGWTPEYLCDLLTLSLDPKRVWDALVQHRWLDRKDGKVLVHDWPDWVGRYLESKYRTSKPELLVRIWALHGRVWDQSVKRRTNDRPRAGLGKEGEVVVPDDLKPNEGEILAWLAYKRERGQGYKPKGVSMLWARIREIPQNKRKEAIEHSMAANYSGIYEKTGGQRGTNATAGYAEAQRGKYPD
jgi:hypothetical protein